MSSTAAEKPSDFKTVYNDPQARDRFYLFLKNVFNIYPEDAFHRLINQATESGASDEDIYRTIQRRLPEIKPFLSDIRYGLPALFKQQKEIARETAELLGTNRAIDGYVEIGTIGRYTNALRRRVKIAGPLYMINDQAPTYSLVDIMDRGQIGKIWGYISLNDYAPIDSAAIPDCSVDLVTCYIGLHHAPLDRLDGFVRSINRILRPGGHFIVRDHEVGTAQMRAFVALAHTVFNAGLGLDWDTNRQELRHFTSVSDFTNYLAQRGFKPDDRGILQDGDPTQNTLMKFAKVDHA